MRFLAFLLPSSSCTHCPLATVNCWPDADSGTITVNLEYELKNPSLSLHNVTISIPLPSGSEPVISDPPAHGTYNINPHTGTLDWVIEEVSEAAGTGSGSLEFEVEGEDADLLFPVGVEFVSQKGMCGVEVRFLPSFMPFLYKAHFSPYDRSSVWPTQQETPPSSTPSTRSSPSTDTRLSKLYILGGRKRDTRRQRRRRKRRTLRAMRLWGRRREEVAC